MSWPRLIKSTMFHFNKKTTQTSKSLLGRSFKKIAWVVGNNAFLFIIIFIVIDILIGEFLFYHYIISPQSEVLSPNQPFVKFQDHSYQSVLKDWKIRSD